MIRNTRQKHKSKAIITFHDQTGTSAHKSKYIPENLNLVPHQTATTEETKPKAFRNFSQQLTPKRGEKGKVTCITD